jgi:large subunit ribosomal protein L25
MSQPIEIVAELRKDVGKGASRRLRRAAEKVPGIIYGGGRESQPITINANALIRAMEKETFYSQILNVVVDGDAQQAVLRDVQRHPASEKVRHVDFLRISADQEIDVHIPLHFINEDKCVGVKQGDGSIVHNMNEVTVRCLPKDLPEYIEVDMTNIQVGHSVHLSDLAFPSGVASVDLLHGADYDSAVVSVLAPRGGAGEAEGGEEAAGGEADSASGGDSGAGQGPA